MANINIDAGQTYRFARVQNSTIILGSDNHSHAKREIYHSEKYLMYKLKTVLSIRIVFNVRLELIDDGRLQFTGE